MRSNERRRSNTAPPPFDDSLELLTEPDTDGARLVGNVIDPQAAANQRVALREPVENGASVKRVIHVNLASDSLHRETDVEIGNRIGWHCVKLLLREDAHVNRAF